MKYFVKLIVTLVLTYWIINLALPHILGAVVISQVEMLVGCEGQGQEFKSL